jgi:hypothetical protein
MHLRAQVSRARPSAVLAVLARRFSARRSSCNLAQPVQGEAIVMKSLQRRSLYLGLSAALLLVLPGCQVIGDIFKAGVWVGILAVAMVAVAIGGVMAMIGRRS